MRCVVLSGLLLAAVWSSGCLVLSLQPAYDDASVAFDEALAGQWENADDQTSATIEQAQWRSYKITYTDRFAARTFQGNLTKIGTASYLDLTEIRGNDFGPYLVPAHGLFRVTLDGDTLTAADLDYGWWTQAMKRKTLGRLSVAIDDRRNVVLASATSELRRWLMRAPAESFGAPMTFTRKR
ncbi:MAG: hypothetical protein HY047_14580 [Acidobacteria bacterium]|nr:hypothetical protein [Acidobacteriota bacterium]